MAKKAKRSKLAKAKADPRSRYWRNKADRAWSERVRAVGKCLVCGTSEKLQAHHLIDRSVHQLRHDLNNGICLCARHHKWDCKVSPHRGPSGIFLDVLFLEQTDWLLDQLRRWDAVRAEPVDYQRAYERLVGKDTLR